MKKYLFAAFLFGNAFLGYGQMVLSSGSQIIVNSGSVLVANDITGSGGTITNHGEVSVLGDIINNSGVLFNSSSTDGTVTFEGSSAQAITGTSSITFYGIVDIKNSSGVALTDDATGAAQTIDGTLNFSNGLLTLNGFNLNIGTTDPTGIGAAKYIKTNSTGVVKRIVANSDVLFPVGNSAYNPLILKNAGDSDTYNVRVVDAEPAGASTVHMVDRSWIVSEDVADGSNLTVTPQWNNGEELSSFDRTKSCIGLTTNGGSDYIWKATGTAVGGDPYTRAGAPFTTVGTFTVGDYYYGGIVIDLQVFLAAAYNTGTHKMDKTLNTAGLLPTTDPYGQSTTIDPVPANAVDWVKIELRAGGDNTSVQHTFARFVDQDGQIIEGDGSDFTMKGVTSGSYYIAIHHRNHFAVVSSSTVNLGNSPTLSFQSIQNKAYQDGSISSNAAMKEVETGVFALWNGDANGDGSIVYNGGSSDRVEILDHVGGVGQMSNVISAVYHANDLNMDGNVVYNGGSSDRVKILDNVGGVDEMSTVLNAHIPE